MVSLLFVCVGCCICLVPCYICFVSDACLKRFSHLHTRQRLNNVRQTRNRLSSNNLFLSIYSFSGRHTLLGAILGGVRWVLWGGLLALLGVLWGVIWRFWGSLGGPFGLLWVLLGALWPALEAYWDVIGDLLVTLGCFKDV